MYFLLGFAGLGLSMERDGHPLECWVTHGWAMLAVGRGWELFQVGMGFGGGELLLILVLISVLIS